MLRGWCEDRVVIDGDEFGKKGATGSTVIDGQARVSKLPPQTSDLTDSSHGSEAALESAAVLLCNEGTTQLTFFLTLNRIRKSGELD